ncbi:YciI family protein [Cellulomonas sp. McL0617]|uniref:YciI family protein n=1 Tax=Cellulomonas sp. McL0617 TaxID=3415675 RepID=UPI003CEF535C
MKYVILIHADPDPWDHPTTAFTAEGRALPPQQRAQMDSEFDALLTELSASGELVMGEALADPRSATVHRWRPGGSLASEGPFAEVTEQLAGFFLIDVATRARAEELAGRFAGPGSPAELRPAMWG